MINKGVMSEGIIISCSRWEQTFAARSSEAVSCRMHDVNLAPNCRRNLLLGPYRKLCSTVLVTEMIVLAMSKDEQQRTNPLKDCGQLFPVHVSAMFPRPNGANALREYAYAKKQTARAN